MSDFTATFAALKAIMQRHEDTLSLVAEGPTRYSLNAGYSTQYRKTIWFGGVEMKKNYVSYHLMPVYMNPALLDGISDALKKRMHGKACFNFKTVDTDLFAELAELTERSIESFRNQKLLD